jgi:hypothetical protein
MPAAQVRLAQITSQLAEHGQRAAKVVLTQEDLVMVLTLRHQRELGFSAPEG